MRRATGMGRCKMANKVMLEVYLSTPESVDEDFDLQEARFAFSADFIEGYDEVNQVLILKGILQGLLDITQGLEEKVQSEKSLMALSAERETRELFERMRKKK